MLMIMGVDGAGNVFGGGRSLPPYPAAQQFQVTKVGSPAVPLPPLVVTGGAIECFVPRIGILPAGCGDAGR